MTRIPIDFVVAGGRTLGLGHVVRSAALAREARFRGWSVRCFLDGDATATEVWERASGARALPWDPDFDGFAPIVALDRPNEKSALLARLDARRARALLIDDARTYRRAPQAPRAWRLLPGLHHPCVETSGATDAEGFALLSGPHYAILSEDHRTCAPRDLDTRSSILVSLGGSDPHRIGPDIARAARRAADTLTRASESSTSLDVDVVFGPAFDDPGDREAHRLEADGCRVHRALDAPAMAERMRAARLAIIGFGTSASELACHGTPFLTVAHHDGDRGPARDLEARGFGRVLGSARHIDRVPIETRVKRALRDDHWMRKSARLGRRAIGAGAGAVRVFDRLEADLALRSARTHEPLPEHDESATA